MKQKPIHQLRTYVMSLAKKKGITNSYQAKMKLGTQNKMELILKKINSLEKDVELLEGV